MVYDSTNEIEAKPEAQSAAARSALRPSVKAESPRGDRVRSSSLDATKTSKPLGKDLVPQRKSKVLSTSEKPSVSEGMKEDPADVLARKKEEEATLTAHRTYQKDLEKELRADEAARKKEEREEQRKIRQEKRDFDAVRRKEAREAISDAAKLKAMSMADMQKILVSHFIGSSHSFRVAPAIHDMFWKS